MPRPKAITKNAITLMKILALNGPATKYHLESTGLIKEEAAPSHGTVLNQIKRLQQAGYLTEFGVQRKPVRKAGRPKETKDNVRIKQENKIKYGLTPIGLRHIFMIDHEVRTQWGKVQQNYQYAKSDQWLSLASEWINNDDLNAAFPLKTKYDESKEAHYEPGPGMFVHSIILSRVSEDKFQSALDEALKLISKQTGDFQILKKLEKEMQRYLTIVSRSQSLSLRLKE